jgi:succinyl-diaminopimelate desuccinylase
MTGMDVKDLCSALVKIRSENPPGSTEDVIEYIRDHLESLGIRGTVTRNRSGRCNFVASEPSNRLLLCGHLDVVPAISKGWTHDPFSGDIDGGYVWGRGSTDMKGGCASIVDALATCIEKGEEPRVNLAFVCDEETDGEMGMKYLLAKKYLHPGDCIVAEPTPPLNPSIGQKGLCRISLEFTGEPGHGSLYPQVGISAVMEAFNLLEYLKLLNQRKFSATGDMDTIFATSSAILESMFRIEGVEDVLRKITFNPGKIRGGEKVNIVAETCRLDLDIRVPWGCNAERLAEEIASQAPRAQLIAHELGPPSLTPPDTTLVRLLCEEIERVYGTRGSPIVQWAASDARFLRKAGFNAVEYGPGEIPTLHGIDERVSIPQLKAASEIFQGIMRQYSDMS